MITSLLVEDNVLFRQSFKEALLTYFPGMQVEEASDGREALEVVQQRSPQLIFVDLKLPGENGLELTKKIKQIDSHAKIVILTAYAAPEYHAAATEAGALCFAIKGSLDMEHVAGLIRELEIE
ncbi:MAG TPA: response regulator transcription factor [Thermodesulfobacteriota bacterium]|nr:response regulator transcription factor [Deltaproteobacteria bacterium]HNU70233.1 response regulator transcription factor [Thermodesulfobacteriota bacterium]HQO76903.1 response regulator transcription factor [Thermodesulfobacteriota bacterium]